MLRIVKDLKNNSETLKNSALGRHESGTAGCADGTVNLKRSADSIGFTTMNDANPTRRLDSESDRGVGSGPPALSSAFSLPRAP